MRPLFVKLDSKFCGTACFGSAPAGVLEQFFALAIERLIMLIYCQLKLALPQSLGQIRG